MKPLAILGGTFDPVHIGHLNAAWEAAELLDAEVRLMPANVPPHRPPPVASAEQRVAMLRAALQGQSRLSLDTRELQREGPSYTVDTLVELRAEQGDRPLVLLLGEDAFAGLPSWHRWHELFELAHMGVLTRPGVEPTWPAGLAEAISGRLTTDPQGIRATHAGRVVLMPITPLEISATRVRELLAAGQQPRYLLPVELLDSPTLLAPYRR
ncbi:nicotinate-nucleotide adenylyltransferase [Rhodanobacter glycinis]|uniref:Probable nicotinate-nucleotide adenylyltransferase n=1 Tax=Rhodanobacter glycinis TaxID=582702 RepID=A0A1I4EIF5_9GAMM|nr:nicotinate-nucleotide adenylyltransferase [Rhodanobacter glycinis]QEE24065.1 nicotinate-nucleotide adenylyltransferase [Rhodanobacter glycinis]SFL04347.1 nicotinate-nucleotide adenylyltransferase [Rhodanobacter glycinis]